MDLRIAPVPLPPRQNGPTVSTVVAAIAVVLAVAIVKPWGEGGGGPGLLIQATGSPPAAAPSRVPGPTPDAARAIVSALCLEPTGWRLYATERWSDRNVRSWKSIEPVAAADGPGDPRVPFFPETSRTILTLGYCAPVTGPERPPGATTTTIYQRLADDVATPSGTPAWETISPQRVQPAVGSSPLGGAWGPPAIGKPGVTPAAPAAGWASGSYVFRIATGGQGAAVYVRWFGVVVEVAPPGGP